MPEDLLTLGIETSCDDTAVALVRGREILADEIASQIADHTPFGGVVPELASRKHQEAMLPVLARAMESAGTTPDDIDLIAVTSGPGLMGSLLVGVMTAKALAQGWGKPLIGANHLEGHMFANMLAHDDLEPPFICLIVSGGHTEIVLCRATGQYELLGTTRDDAAGEAYDKASKILGMGYPGGPVIERAARDGDPDRFAFPIALRGSHEIEFSFSGVKTAFRTEVERQRASGGELPVSDLCASFQRAVTLALIQKTELAVRRTGVRRLSLSGGVAANSELREAFTALAPKMRAEVYLPPKRFCTDNAAMIAAAGAAAYARGARSDLRLTADPSWSIW